MKGKYTLGINESPQMGNFTKSDSVMRRFWLKFIVLYIVFEIGEDDRTEKETLPTILPYMLSAALFLEL